MDKKSKFGLDKSALKSSYKDFNNLVDLLKSNKSIQKKAIFEFENEKEPDKRVYNIHGLNNRAKQKVDGFINYNKLCFDVNKFMENEEKVNYDGNSLCSSFSIDHEMKKTYILADPRFLAGEKSETDANFYVLKINVKNEYTIDKISFDDVTKICNPEYEQLSTPGKIAAKEKVMQKVFGFEEISLVNESEGTNLSHKISEEEKLFDDFKEYVEKKDPNSMGILNAAKNDFDKLLKDKNGNPVNNLIGQKMLIMDPRVQSGLLAPTSPEAAFYFIKQNSPTSKPKFEKVSFNDVLDFVVRDDMKSVKKPHRGFFGTIADFFTKETEGRRKYEREKEVYYANKCYILEQRFGMKNLEYNHDLTDTAKADKYINDRINAAVDKKVKNESLTPLIEDDMPEAAPEMKQKNDMGSKNNEPEADTENKDRDFDLDDDYLQLSDEMIKKRDIALQRLDMLAESGEKTVEQGVSTIKALFGMNLKFEDDTTCEEVRDLAKRVIKCLSQPIVKDSTNWEDHPKWDEMKDFCKYIGMRGDVSGQTLNDIKMNVSTALAANEEKLKKPVSTTDLVVYRLDALKQNEDSYIRSGADEIKNYILKDPERKTEGCKLMINFFSMTKGDMERQKAFCEEIGNCKAYNRGSVNDIVNDLLNPNPNPDDRLKKDEHLTKIHDELTKAQLPNLLQ